MKTQNIWDQCQSNFPDMTSVLIGLWHIQRWACPSYWRSKIVIFGHFAANIWPLYDLYFYNFAIFFGFDWVFCAPKHALTVAAPEPSVSCWRRTRTSCWYFQIMYPQDSAQILCRLSYRSSWSPSCIYCICPHSGDILFFLLCCTI